MNNKIKINWIKAHVGHPGNEKADALAKEGCVATNIRQVPPSMAAVKEEAEKEMLERWRDRWEGSTEYRQTKFWFKNRCRKKSDSLIRLSRPTLGGVIQAVSGFNNLNYHSSNKDDNVDPTCRTCGKEKEEFIHVATECDPILGQARATMPSLHGRTDGWDVSELVNFLDLDRVHYLMTTRAIN